LYLKVTGKFSRLKIDRVGLYFPETLASVTIRNNNNSQHSAAWNQSTEAITGKGQQLQRYYVAHSQVFYGLQS
jgi:hypothetical protein